MKEQLALYQCLNVIRISDNMEPFRQFLKDQRDQCRDRLETLSGEALLIEQGRSQTYKLLHERIEDALKYLENIENSRRP
jgi:hypothetical protein